VLTYEYKCDGTKQQYAAIEEVIRVVQLIRNKCLRKWMDERGVSKNDLQCYCAVLAQDYPFAACLNSQARQASADRAWFAISRFYDNCKNHTPGKKDYPHFQHDNRSVEYKTTVGSWTRMVVTSPSPMAVILGGFA
jgi:transposase